MALPRLQDIYSGSHEQAVQDITQLAMEQDLQMLQGASDFRESVATQRIDLARQSTMDARKMAARQLGSLTRDPGASVVGDVVMGWSENYLQQLTPTAVATGAPMLAARRFSEMKETLNLGVVKDLSELIGE
jgi:hypothetical protein